MILALGVINLTGGIHHQLLWSQNNAYAYRLSGVHDFGIVMEDADLDIIQLLPSVEVTSWKCLPAAQNIVPREDIFN